MKKQTTRFALLTLLCVPFLTTATTLVNAENTTNTQETLTTAANTEETTNTIEIDDALSIQDQTISNEVNSPKQNQKEESSEIDWSKVSIQLDSTKIDGDTNSTGQFKLAAKQDSAFDGIDLKGKFKETKTNFIEVDSTGKWKALKTAENEKTILEYVFNQDTQDKLNEMYPNEDFSKPFKTEEVNVTFKEVDKEDANIQLEIVGGQLKEVKGQLKVKVKDGQELTGKFKPLTEKEPMTLTEDGAYEIGEKARYNKLNQKVTFILDTKSYDALSQLEVNEGKNVAKEYDVTVTKQAQKDITVTFKNQGINTQIGGKGRLLPNENIEGIKMDEQEMKDLRFKPLTDNDFLTIDELGNWEAKKTGNGPLYPAVVLSETTMKKLAEAFPDNDLNIVGEKVDVSITQSGSNSGNGTNNKKYEPVSNLPQTGEEKMKFAGVIGLVVIALAGVLFFFKKKKSDQ